MNIHTFIKTLNYDADEADSTRQDHMQTHISLLLMNLYQRLLWLLNFLLDCIRLSRDHDFSQAGKQASKNKAYSC